MDVPEQLKVKRQHSPVFEYLETCGAITKNWADNLLIPLTVASTRIWVAKEEADEHMGVISIWNGASSEVATAVSFEIRRESNAKN
jgi:hypothetical protein